MAEKTGESQRESGKLVWAVAATIILADLALLVSGYRILLSETMTPAAAVPNQKIDVAGVAVDSRFLPTSGGLLTCRYFTGRDIKTVHFAMVEGVDECPFVYSSRAPA